MLAKRKYAKWGKQEEKLEYDLKETPKDDKPKLKHIERVSLVVLLLSTGILNLVLGTS